MIAYSYDEKGYYICEVECQLDPLETEIAGEEVYLLPAYATYEKPLEEKEGFKVRFVDGGWTYEEIPEPEPEPEPTPEEKKQARIAELKEELNSTDYKIIKCSECSLAGVELPYNIVELHAQRQAIREEINKLEG